jgi:hypothetical protein
MKASVTTTLVFLGIAGHAVWASAEPIAHQVVGKWQTTRSADGCTETHDYRSDGTLVVISGARETTSTYTISDRQNAQGYYELKVQPLKYNDAPRCPGSPLSSDAAPHAAYLIFHRTQPLHLICETPGLDKCLGPLRRVYP